MCFFTPAEKLGFCCCADIVNLMYECQTTRSPNIRQRDLIGRVTGKQKQVGLVPRSSADLQFIAPAVNDECWLLHFAMRTSQFAMDTALVGIEIDLCRQSGSHLVCIVTVDIFWLNLARPPKIVCNGLVTWQFQIR